MVNPGDVDQSYRHNRVDSCIPTGSYTSSHILAAVTTVIWWMGEGNGVSKIDGNELIIIRPQCNCAVCIRVYEL